MTVFHRILRKIAYGIPCLILLFLLCFRVTVRGETSQSVKVGYYENEIFEEGAAAGSVKTGYAYEYYRKLSEYTGWDYEYIYGSYSELYDMLVEGKIDLLAGLAKREDRIGVIGYPEDPMGSETYSLVRHDDDMSVTWSPSSVAGKRIGVLKSAVSEVLTEYLDAHEVEAEVVLFTDYESLFEAFDTRQIDILAAEGDGARGREHAEVICPFGSSDYYLCVSLLREDLLEELNAAQSALAAEEPGYLNSLRSRYYSASVSGHAFSEAERKWMQEHTSIRVGYLNNYLPYSATDKSGMVTGIVKELIPGICSALSLPDMEFSFTGYDNYDDMIKDVCSEKIDVAFPVGGGLYYSEENGIYQTSPVISTSTELVYSGDYDSEGVPELAVSENNRMQYYYIRINIPEAEITLYPDIDSCLEAVLEGRSKATTLNGMRANEILKNRKYEGLYLKQLSQVDDRCFGVKIGNEGLLKLLNRGISILGPEYALDMAYEYAEGLYSYTAADMVRDNIWLFLTLLLGVAVLIIVFVVRDLKRSRLSERMKSDFVSNMSHEIRTPITAILGMNEMIQQESEDEEILAYADNIEKAGESLLGIINDILDFSKIEAGRMELTVAPYSLSDLLRDLELMIGIRAQEKNLSFSLEADASLPAKPIGDMQKLRQILTNLLTNAVKYTEKGEVVLTLKRLSSSDSGFVLEAAVRDTGIGIKEEEMEKLYSAFDRLDLDRTKNIQGTGLGLAITKRLVEMMGSEIRVESEYGRGSRFSFSLEQGIEDPTPIGSFRTGEPGKKEQRTKRQATFTAPSARLLVVDDTPMNLQVICGLLKGNRMTVETADSGQECLRLLGEDSYDIVFLDQRMPGMDGVETLWEIRKRFPGSEKSMPVISLTANAFSTAREEMLKAGFTDYLSKPVKLSELEEVLLKYLPKEKILSITEGEEREEEDNADPSGIERGIEVLRAIPELDVDRGIRYCGDEEDYLEALQIYHNSIRERSERLEELDPVSDTQELLLLIHSLKSTSRTVGAIRLSAFAGSIESALQRNDTEAAGGYLKGFLEQYRLLGEKLDEAGEYFG